VRTGGGGEGASVERSDAALLTSRLRMLAAMRGK